MQNEERISKELLQRALQVYVVTVWYRSGEEPCPRDKPNGRCTSHRNGCPLTSRSIKSLTGSRVVLHGRCTSAVRNRKKVFIVADIVLGQIWGSKAASRGNPDFAFGRFV